MAKKKEEQVTENIVKEEIIELLRKTQRAGIEDLITEMENMGFFIAPASGANHSNGEGGLARHSLNVMHLAEKIGVTLLGGEEYNEIKNSVTIVAILHDLGKCGDYGKQLYVPSILKSGEQSKAKPWKRNPDLSNIPHGVRSAIITERWIDLTEDEEYAICYHDGLYEPSNVAVIKQHETQLYMLLHWADMWASKVLEESEGDE